MKYRGINFNGTHSTATKLEYWCNFWAGTYWLANRLLVLCKVTNPTASEGLYAMSGSDSPFGMVKYELDADGYCIIDFTDFYRTYRGTREMWLWYGVGDPNDASTDLVTLLDDTPKGLINPAGVFIPSHISTAHGITISAPLLMYASPYNAIKVQFEMFGSNSYEFATGRVKFQPGGTIVDFARAVEVPSGTDAIEFWHLTDAIRYKNQMQQSDCADVAVVEWRSFSGQIRRHVFEMEKHKIETGDSFTILSLDGQPFEIKGRKDSFTLRLSNLCAYDVWYYADVITSSEVNVCLDGTNWARVEVTSKSVNVPNDDETSGKVEITVKWKEYDAVSM